MSDKFIPVDEFYLLQELSRVTTEYPDVFPDGVVPGAAEIMELNVSAPDSIDTAMKTFAFIVGLHRKTGEAS